MLESHRQGDSLEDDTKSINSLDNSMYRKESFLTNSTKNLMLRRAYTVYDEISLTTNGAFDRAGGFGKFIF
jgi:hypothetical protein